MAPFTLNGASDWGRSGFDIMASRFKVRIVMALLQNVPIFAGLESPALELLLDHTTEQEFDPGGVIVREGDKSHSMFVIATGRVKVCKEFGTPGEIVLATLGPKDFFGEMCIVDTLPRCATIQAVEPARVIGISAMAFYKLYKSMPAQHSVLVVNIARDLSRRLRKLDEAFAGHH
jgi:CRP-like cAMP-binding protein